MKTGVEKSWVIAEDYLIILMIIIQNIRRIHFLSIRLWMSGCGIRRRCRASTNWMWYRHEGEENYLSFLVENINQKKSIDEKNWYFVWSVLFSLFFFSSCLPRTTDLTWPTEDANGQSNKMKEEYLWEALEIRHNHSMTIWHKMTMKKKTRFDEYQGRFTSNTLWC